MNEKIAFEAYWLLLIIPVVLIFIYVIVNSVSIKNLYRDDLARFKEQNTEFNSKLKNTELEFSKMQVSYENKIKEQLIEFQNKLNEQILNYGKKEAELKVKYQDLAIARFEEFKKKELTILEKRSVTNALKLASVKLQEWKIQNESEIRKDAINRSYAVNLGKITEHLVPFHEVFLSQFNPKDSRFIGSPIDLIVFDGYSDKKEDITLYLVEIKTGNSKLTDTQKKIKEAVLEGRFRWAEINPDNKDRVIDIGKSIVEKAAKIDFKNEFEEVKVQKQLFSSSDAIYSLFIQKIKTGLSQNQALKTACHELGVTFTKNEWENFKKITLRKYNQTLR